MKCPLEGAIMAPSAIWIARNVPNDQGHPFLQILSFSGGDYDVRSRVSKMMKLGRKYPEIVVVRRLARANLFIWVKQFGGATLEPANNATRFMCRRMRGGS
jgi:hypothetical protein